MSSELTKRQKRVYLAAEFFDLLREADELERKAKKLRAKAKRLRDENPILANLDNRIDSFNEEKQEKRVAKAEKPQEKPSPSPASNPLKRQAILLAPTVVPDDKGHLHLDPVTKEYVQCSKVHEDFEME